MKNHKGLMPVCLLVTEGSTNLLVVICCVLVCDFLSVRSTSAASLSAYAHAAWTSDLDEPASTVNYNCTDGTYDLNALAHVLIDPVVTDDKSAHSLYSSGSNSVVASASGGVVTSDANALSDIHVSYASFNCSYKYTMTVSASVDIGAIFGPSANALAGALDPQFLASPGIVAGGLSLGAGSSVFAARPGLDSAEVTYAITTPLLPTPIASLHLTNTGSGVVADVAFASIPLLKFYDPVTLAPLTAADIKASLESTPGLGTDTGLASALTLFAYSLDHSGGPLPPDAAIGSSGTSMASSVPEPSTFVLGIVAMAGLGFVALRKKFLRAKNTAAP